jgi:hypothetical protein
MRGTNTRKGGDDRSDASALMTNYVWFKYKWKPHYVIDRIREFDSTSTTTAIERGLMLCYLRLTQKMFLVESDYEKYKVGFGARTGEMYITIATNPRMTDYVWDYPSSWYPCYVMLTLPLTLFEVMIGFKKWNGVKLAVVDRYTNLRIIREFRRHYENVNQRQLEPLRDAAVAVQRTRNAGVAFLNQAHCEDCLTFIEKLTDNSISLVIFSPPYAEQRSKGKTDKPYRGKSEKDFPGWIALNTQSSTPETQNRRIGFIHHPGKS